MVFKAVRMNAGERSGWSQWMRGCLAASVCLTVTLTRAEAGPGDFSETLSTQPVVEEPAGEPLEFSFIINGWGPWVSLTSPRGTKIDIGLDDIIDGLDMAAMFGVGVRKGKWGFTTEAIYADISLRPDGSILDKVEVQEWIVTPKISYRALEGDWGFLDVSGGARYTNVKLDIIGNRILGGAFNERASGHLWDGLVGVRGEYRISDRWYMPFMADVGTGDSDFAAQVYAGIGYRFKYADVVLGFRYLYYDFASGAPLQDETVWGPILTIGFTF